MSDLREQIDPARTRTSPRAPAAVGDAHAPDAPGREAARLAVAAHPSRLPAIDRVRGLAIVLMALDHVRDYFSDAHYSPTDLAHTTPALFFTRWITHYCAPSFIFLAGTSAFLFGRRSSRREGRASARETSHASLSRFLLTRGLWLVLLEFTVVTFMWSFNFQYRMGLIMQVIWATGVSMCVLSALVALPAPAVGAIGVVMIASHNALDDLTPERFGRWASLWKILHVQAQTPFGMVVYPLIPWIGVMAAGYAFGRVYLLQAPARRRVLCGLGAGLSLAFVALRLLNGYGDPSPWSPQAQAWLTTLSFLNVSKYPPSLAYLSMTLGPTLLALALFERFDGWLADAFETFGRVPLFAYVVHLGLAHLLAGLAALALGFGASVLTQMFMYYPERWGFGLAGVYVAWLLVLALLLPACRWFAAVKRRRSDWWLAYL